MCVCVGGDVPHTPDSSRDASAQEARYFRDNPTMPEKRAPSASVARHRGREEERARR